MQLLTLILEMMFISSINHIVFWGTQTVKEVVQYLEWLYYTI